MLVAEGPKQMRLRSACTKNRTDDKAPWVADGANLLVIGSVLSYPAFCEVLQLFAACFPMLVVEDGLLFAYAEAGDICH